MKKFQKMQNENKRHTKTTICGIQGSGKTELAKYFASKFKYPAWYLVHLDDMIRMPENVKVIKAEEKDIKELNRICNIVIKSAKKGLIDCLIIDEADMFISGNKPLPKHINDLVINHRHYNISVIFITRRPQDIPAKIIESCENLFIFALPNSTNIDYKLNGIDKEILNHPTYGNMMKELSIENHKCIIKKLDKSPEFMSAINLEAMKLHSDTPFITVTNYISDHSEKVSESYT